MERVLVYLYAQVHSMEIQPIFLTQLAELVTQDVLLALDLTKKIALDVGVVSITNGVNATIVIQIVKYAQAHPNTTVVFVLPTFTSNQYLHV
jgi:hypothetical protein